MSLICVQIALSRKFLQLGQFIARHPFIFLLIPILITAILTTGFLRIHEIRDSDYLFTAINGRAITNRKLIEKFFSLNNSEFADVSRLTRPENLIIITPKKGKYIFKMDIIKEIEILDKMVRNITVSYRGKLFRYSDLCAINLGKCFESTLIRLLPKFNEIIDGKYKLKYPADVHPLTFYFEEYVFTFGEVILDQKNYIKDARAARLIYILNTDRTDMKELHKNWENNFNKLLQSLEFENINIAFLNSQNIYNELKELTNQLIPRTPFAFLMVLVFSIVTSMTNDWVRSKPWLGPSACISSVLAIISGFGLVFHLGIPYIDASYLLAFIILGTEIDDAFLQIAAWRRSNVNDSVEKRLGDVYAETAVSITITSLTSIASFCIGMSSPFPIIRLFCFYAAIMTLFAYIYQITFFGSCMALSGFIEKKGHNALIFCHTRGKENKTKLSNKNRHEDFILAKFRDKIGSLLINNSFRVVVLLVFFINISTAIWSLKFVKVGNDYSDVFSHDSQTGSFTDLLYKHFHSYLYPVSIVIEKPLDYNNFQVRKAINDTLNAIESHDNLADYKYRMSWLKYFDIFSNSTFGTILLSGYDMSDKQDFIDALSNVFFELPQSKLFKYDIVFNENRTEIIATRFLSGLINISSREMEAKTVQDIYKIADSSPIPIKFYGLNFHLIEQSFLVKKVIFQVGLITSALIFVIFFVFIPNAISVMCVAIVVFCTILETISYMSLWGAKLDLISLITFVLCVGFSVNYPTHLSFSFIVCNNLNSEERIRKCLYEVGLPIFQGVLTTILSISILAFQSFYLTVTVFKILFLVCVLTGFHSMFVIPILLSLLEFCKQSIECKMKK